MKRIPSRCRLAHLCLVSVADFLTEVGKPPKVTSVAIESCLLEGYSNNQERNHHKKKWRGATSSCSSHFCSPKPVSPSPKPMVIPTKSWGQKTSQKNTFGTSNNRGQPAGLRSRALQSLHFHPAWPVAGKVTQQPLPCLVDILYYLVGGWTNPFEKYARQIGSFP